MTSQVYGSSKSSAENLRNLTNDLGLLRVNEQFRDGWCFVTSLSQLVFKKKKNYFGDVRQHECINLGKNDVIKLVISFPLLKLFQKFYRAVNGLHYLPFNPNMPCVQDQFDASGVNINCFLAGDPRWESLSLDWMRQHTAASKHMHNKQYHLVLSNRS